MKAALYARTAMFLAAVLSAPAGAPIVTDEQLCAKGDRTACRLVELANGRDFRTMLGKGAQYKLVPGPHALWSSLQGDAWSSGPCSFSQRARSTMRSGSGETSRNTSS